MPHPTVRNARKTFLDALDTYVDTRIAYLDSCAQVEALEYRLQRPDLHVPDGAQALEELRGHRHARERTFKEARLKLSQKLDAILGG